jgi:hypothetical protein
VAEKKKRPEAKGGQTSSAPPELLDQVRSSGLIFTGTVVERGKSSVPTLPARENLLVVRLDLGPLSLYTSSSCVSYRQCRELLLITVFHISSSARVGFFQRGTSVRGRAEVAL